MRPRAAGAVRVALFTREAEEARPAGRWRRRGRGRPGGAAAAARARLLLQAGRRGARPAAGPRSGGRGRRRGALRGAPRGPGWGAAARGAVPVVRGLAHQAGRLCLLPGEVAVEGQHRGVAMLGLCGHTARSAAPPRPGPAAARPPAARRTKGRGRYLGPCAPGTRPPPAGSAGNSAPSSARAPALSGTAAAAARPSAAGSARRPPRAPGGPTSPTPPTPCALGRHPPPRALKLTHKGERRPAQPMGAGAPAPGAGAGPGRGQWELAERLGPGREC